MTFDISNFKGEVGELARTALFDVAIEGYDKAHLLIRAVDFSNGEPHRLEILENEDCYTHNMLAAIFAATDDQKATVGMTITRYRKDGTAYSTEKYKIKSLSYDDRLDWNDTSKIKEYSAWIDVEKA